MNILLGECAAKISRNLFDIRPNRAFHSGECDCSSINTPVFTRLLHLNSHSHYNSLPHKPPTYSPTLPPSFTTLTINPPHTPPWDPAGAWDCHSSDLEHKEKGPPQGLQGMSNHNHNHNHNPNIHNVSQAKNFGLTTSKEQWSLHLRSSLGFFNA